MINPFEKSLADLDVLLSDLQSYIDSSEGHSKSLNDFTKPSYSCEDCEFFCWTEQNFGKCNVSLDKALGWGVCDNFRPIIPRRNEYVVAFDTFRDTVSELNSSVFNIIAPMIQPFSPEEPSKRQNDVCLSCGSLLEIQTRGRRKFCAHCGCYLPEIIYSKDLTA